MSIHVQGQVAGQRRAGRGGHLEGRQRVAVEGLLRQGEDPLEHHRDHHQGVAALVARQPPGTPRGRTSGAARRSSRAASTGPGGRTPRCGTAAPRCGCASRSAAASATAARPRRRCRPRCAVRPWACRSCPRSGSRCGRGARRRRGRSRRTPGSATRSTPRRIVAVDPAEDPDVRCRPPASSPVNSSSWITTRGPSRSSTSTSCGPANAVLSSRMSAPQLGGGDAGVDEAAVVAAHHRDAVALADAALGQGPGQGVGAPVHLAEGQRTRARRPGRPGRGRASPSR